MDLDFDLWSSILRFLPSTAFVATVCKVVAAAARHPVSMSVLVVPPTVPQWMGSPDEKADAMQARLTLFERVLPRMVQSCGFVHLVRVEISIASAVVILDSAHSLRHVTLTGIGGAACSTAIIALAAAPALATLVIKGACSPITTQAWATLFGSNLHLDSLFLGVCRTSDDSDISEEPSDFKDEDAERLVDVFGHRRPVENLHISCPQLTGVGFMNTSGTPFRRVFLGTPYKARYKAYENDEEALDHAFLAGAAFRHCDSLEIRSVAGGDPGYEVQLDAVIQGLGTAESLKSLHLYENAEFDEECEANRVALYDGFLDVLSATGFTLNELRIDGAWMSPLEHTYDIASVELAFINHSLRVLNLGEIGMGIENLGPRISIEPFHAAIRHCPMLEELRMSEHEGPAFLLSISLWCPELTKMDLGYDFSDHLDDIKFEKEAFGWASLHALDMLALHCPKLKAKAVNIGLDYSQTFVDVFVGTSEEHRQPDNFLQRLLMDRKCFGWLAIQAGPGDWMVKARKYQVRHGLENFRRQTLELVLGYIREERTRVRLLLSLRKMKEANARMFPIVMPALVTPASAEVTEQ